MLIFRASVFARCLSFGFDFLNNTARESMAFCSQHEREGRRGGGLPEVNSVISGTRPNYEWVSTAPRIRSCMLLQIDGNLMEWTVRRRSFDFAKRFPPRSSCFEMLVLSPRDCLLWFQSRVKPESDEEAQTALSTLTQTEQLLETTDRKYGTFQSKRRRCVISPGRENDKRERERERKSRRDKYWRGSWKLNCVSFQLSRWFLLAALSAPSLSSAHYGAAASGW